MIGNATLRAYFFVRSYFALHGRPPLIFLRYFYGELVWLLLLLCHVALWFEDGNHFNAIPCFFFGFILACVASKNPWRWRLVMQTWSFRTHTSARVVIHYAGQLQGRWDWAVLVERVEPELAELAQQFQFRLRSPIVVFLFPGWQMLSRIFGGPLGGTALSPANAVLLTEEANLQEILRHELTHLFSAQWSRRAPPLLEEGLAVWWQRTRNGWAIESLAESLLQNRSLVRTFQQEWKGLGRGGGREACYLLAGYFTQFLIQRFGWERYERFYRKASTRNFTSQFYRIYGISLAKAEAQCRYYRFARDLLARRTQRL